MDKILPGMKTHIVAMLAIVIGIIEVVTGNATGWHAIVDNANLLLGGLGLSTLRIGIATK